MIYFILLGWLASCGGSDATLRMCDDGDLVLARNAAMSVYIVETELVTGLPSMTTATTDESPYAWFAGDVLRVRIEVFSAVAANATRAPDTHTNVGLFVATTFHVSLCADAHNHSSCHEYVAKHAHGVGYATPALVVFLDRAWRRRSLRAADGRTFLRLQTSPRPISLAPVVPLCEARAPPSPAVGICHQVVLWGAADDGRLTPFITHYARHGVRRFYFFAFSTDFERFAAAARDAEAAARRCATDDDIRVLVAPFRNTLDDNESPRATVTDQNWPITYEKCMMRYRRDTSWLLFLDMDEFAVVDKPPARFFPAHLPAAANASALTQLSHAALLRRKTKLKQLHRVELAARRRARNDSLAERKKRSGAAAPYTPSLASFLASRRARTTVVTLEMFQCQNRRAGRTKYAVRSAALSLEAVAGGTHRAANYLLRGANQDEFGALKWSLQGSGPLKDAFPPSSARFHEGTCLVHTNLALVWRTFGAQCDYETLFATHPLFTCDVLASKSSFPSTFGAGFSSHAG